VSSHFVHLKCFIFTDYSLFGDPSSKCFPSQLGLKQYKFQTWECSVSPIIFDFVVIAKRTIHLIDEIFLSLYLLQAMLSWTFV
jgi:hypothetical protein